MAAKGQPKSGGRVKGTPNRKTKVSRQITDAILQKNQKLLPLDVMLEAMTQVYHERGAVPATPFAEKAAPYLHPRMEHVKADVDHSGNLTITWPLPKSKLENQT